MSSTVTIFIVSPDIRTERRFDLHITIKQLKAKLELITGIPLDAQILLIYNNEEDANSNKSLVNELNEDERPLGYYSVKNGHVLKVVDRNPSAASNGQFTDVSRVQKFELSEQEYAQRQDSVLAYKQRHQVGRFAPKSDQEILIKASPEIVIGARCEVVSDDIDKRGTVRFVGPTSFGKVGGDWVGVEYDEPVGKNDGSVESKRYFTCRPKYGAFVRPDKVRIGDYPELSLDEEM